MSDFEDDFVPAPTPHEDEGKLNFTQDIRSEIIQRIMDDLDVSDSKLMGTLNKFVDGMDKQVIGLKRITANEKVGSGLTDVANALNAYYATIPDRPKLTRHDGDIIEGDYRPVVPELPAVAFIEGQLEPVGAPVDLDEIVRKGIENAKK